MSRATYTKRQMMEAPTNEMAIGMKMIDLATDSSFTRSASTAIARPSRGGEDGHGEDPPEVVHDRAPQHRQHAEHDHDHGDHQWGPESRTTCRKTITGTFAQHQTDNETNQTDQYTQHRTMSS